MKLDVRLARHLEYILSAYNKSVKHDARRTIINSECLGKERNEGNNGSNGRLHDFGNWDFRPGFRRGFCVKRTPSWPEFILSFEVKIESHHYWLLHCHSTFTLSAPLRQLRVRACMAWGHKVRSGCSWERVDIFKTGLPLKLDQNYSIRKPIEFSRHVSVKKEGQIIVSHPDHVDVLKTSHLTHVNRQALPDLWSNQTSFFTEGM